VIVKHPLSIKRISRIKIQKKMKKFIFNLLIISLLVSCQKEQISTGTNISDNFFLQSEGISMPIQVFGNMASKKILFIIHGGPGGSALEYRNDYVANNVEKEFAVVYWDQRFGGGSQGNSGSPDIALFKSDLKKVVQLVKSRYGNDKQLYIMGHSWGGFLTPYFLEDGNNQDLFKGWIQVDGAHNYYLNDSLTKEMLLFYGKREIAANKNKDKWQPIVDYCNAHAYNESFDVADHLNRYARSAQGYMDEVINKPGSILKQLLQSGNNFPITSEISNLVNSALIQKIGNHAYPIPISENLYKLKLPTLLLWGKYDFVCPQGLIKDIRKNVSSKDITEKNFENSGHSPMGNEEVLFWRTVVDWVKVH
jgi:pimeloyl-ACP methyl ester carboxylesterase